MRLIDILPMRRVECDRDEVPISMDEHSIHGCNATEILR